MFHRFFINVGLNLHCTRNSHESLITKTENQLKEFTLLNHINLFILRGHYFKPIKKPYAQKAYWERVQLLCYKRLPKDFKSSREIYAWPIKYLYLQFKIKFKDLLLYIFKCILFGITFVLNIVSNFFNHF